MANEVVRTISIRVNDIEPGKSIKNIKAEFKALRETVENATEKNEAYYKNVARLGQLKGAINDHNTQVRQVAKGWDETEKSATKSKSSFKDALGGFLDFKNLTVAGLATTLVAAAAAFGAELIQVSKEINKLKGEIQNLTGLTDDALDKATANSTALARVFGDDAFDIAQTANSLAKEFSISFDEALAVIEEGYINGGNVQGDFLDQLREYAPVLKESGKSAEDLAAQIIKAGRSGEFSDYGLAAIEEAQLRLREMPKATADALGAIGLSSKEISAQIGKEGIGAAIETVSKQFSKFKDDSPEVGKALAGVFGAAGEKAGVQYIKSLKEVGGNIEDLTHSSNSLVNQQARQLESEKELAAVQTELSEEIQFLTTGTGVFVTNLKTGLLQVVVAVIRQFQNLISFGKSLYENIGIIRMVVDNVTDTFKTLFNIIVMSPQIFNGVSKALEALGANFTNYFKNLASETKIAFEQAKNIIGKGDVSVINAERAKIKARSDAKGIKDAFLEGFNEKNNIPKIAIETPKPPTTLPTPPKPPTTPTGGVKAPVSKEIVDENRESLERLTADIQKFHEENRIKQLSENQREIEAIKAKYKEQLELAKQLKGTESAEFIALTELQNNEIAAKQAEHIAEISAKELEQKEKLEKDKLEKEKEYQEAKAELQAEIDIELMSDLEREFEAIDAHYEALIEEAKQYGLDLSIIKDLEAKQDADRLDAQLKNQEKKEDDALNRYKERLSQRATAYQALGSIFGSVAQLMVDEEGNALAAQKVFALAEIALNAASGISGAIAAGAGIPFPGNLAAIATGVGAVVTGISQARAVFAQQKKDGGYVQVMGQDDGKTYNAKRIGTAATGMLPSSPVLLQSEVLASESGAEYFVSNKSLQNPAVMDLVRMIDNIESGRGVRQFKTGGSIGNISGDSSLLSAVLSAVTTLNNKISDGLSVNIGYKEIEKMNRLSDDLKK